MRVQQQRDVRQREGGRETSRMWDEPCQAANGYTLCSLHDGGATGQSGTRFTSLGVLSSMVSPLG